ncbi:MAG: hypothetical protein JW969_16900 [Spirochaetales bacterium]|nr:hypothetical protein [Spirochaetales bacterium]
MKFISHSELNANTKITGLLGRPLGEIITVEGKTIESSESKSDEGKIFLVVSSVNGKKLKSTERIPLQFFSWAEVTIPKAGRNVKYTGYETGAYTGIPYEAFKHLPYAATEEYHFTVWFQVCEEKY